MSNLSFISKVIDEVIASLLLKHMEDNNLLEKMQSVYKSGHSMETALLQVHNDTLKAVDDRNKKLVLLVLLDLSAAFDSVDHVILLSFLENYIGLSGSVLTMLKSYLHGRTQSIYL